MPAGEYAAKGKQAAGEYASKGRQAAGDAQDAASDAASSSIGDLKAALTSYSEWLKDIKDEVTTSTSKSTQVCCMLMPCWWRSWSP